MDLRTRKCKIKLSYAAHKACKANGDLYAAIGYLEEAKRYELERIDEFDEKLSTLRFEMCYASKTKQSVVVWELETK